MINIKTSLSPDKKGDSSPNKILKINFNSKDNTPIMTPGSVSTP
jgi:hypothetical protein